MAAGYGPQALAVLAAYAMRMGLLQWLEQYKVDRAQQVAALSGKVPAALSRLCACILDQLLGHPEHSQPVIDTPPAQPDHYPLPQCSGSHTTRSCAIPDVMTWCELLTCTLRRMWCASSAKGGRSCALTRRQTRQYSRYALACLWAPSVAGATPPRGLLDNEP